MKFQELQWFDDENPITTVPFGDLDISGSTFHSSRGAFGSATERLLSISNRYF
jgi:hypothetical protein